MTEKKAALPVIVAFTALCLITLAPFAEAQIYKSTDDKGNPSYTDDPTPSNEKRKIPASPLAGEYFQGGTGEIETKDKSVKDEAKETGAEGKAAGGVIVVGGKLSFQHSATGHAVIRATIKNSSGNPVDGLRLDVILFNAKGEKAADLSIPFKKGREAPGKLEPGESGEIVYETEVRIETIVGHRYRLDWNTYSLTKKEKPKQP